MISARTLPANGTRRVVIERVWPELDGGRFPIKRTLGEECVVSADVFADGHDVLAAVVRYRHLPARRSGKRRVTVSGWHEAPMTLIENDRWAGRFTVLELGRYEYTIDAWVDDFATWRAALAKRLAANQIAESDLLEGAAHVRAAAARASKRPRRSGSVDSAWLDARAAEIDASSAPDGVDTEPTARARLALDDALAVAMARHPDRHRATTYDTRLLVLAERERARNGAWYEMFPRSNSPEPGRSATFREAESRLPVIAAMGFDVLYLPPIHPIGTTARKGPGNVPTAAPADPGSPWAIGSPDGGHKSVEPGLGTLDDFDHFVAAARDVDLEIALDIAYQCSPDHPYVTEHPEWFRHRPDGTIKYAENPPKKYQDIYPFDFDTDAWPALWTELKSVLTFWADRGIRIFRVDNPHTKPYAFWEWAIGEVQRDYPDAIFLAEAFTRPKVMQQLAKLGFTQSYSYFTWRNTKSELIEYFTELTQTGMREYFRPNLFANTPDILHAYLQQGGQPAFQIRLILAATLGASYGIYSGFELCEHWAVPGTEEYVHSEKYEYRRREWDRPGHIIDLVRTVNHIRRSEPALQFNDGLRFHETDNPEILAFSKSRLGDSLLVVVSLDPAGIQQGMVRAPMAELGFGAGGAYDVDDLLDGARYTWSGDSNYVRLEPGVRVAHILIAARRT